MLSAGRAIFQGLTAGYGRIGLSASARQGVEDFMNGGAQLFNQLYAATEDQELYNTISIKALRAKNQSLLSEATRSVIASETNGTNVDKTV
ncbi:MAG: hypothetical protein DI626_08235 [Micavibrio aeruginosavorus]|uniref:Uncharacterized protein n=1 Tax=Micavibrio aeruginosavorus TaxID=349221 RepID=A0A2W4ZW72_9BACT|nr:MAG: hypothetical protein DI626_08235 [Micavibrio aeruginosavorus]